MQIEKMKNHRNKFILAFSIVTLTALCICIGIYYENKKSDEYTKTCFANMTINAKNEYLSLWFISKYEAIARKGVAVNLIRSGNVIENIKCKQNIGDNAVELLMLPQIKMEDSLEIIFKNQHHLFLHRFKNGLDYGGEKVIGCVLKEYYENNERKFVSDGSTITID